MELIRVRASLWQPVQISCMAFGPSRLAVGRENGSLELWDPESWHLISCSPGRRAHAISSMVWADQRLLTAGLHREITEWDPETLEPIESASSGGGAVWCLTLADQQLIAACDDGSLRILSLEGGRGSLMYTRRITVERSRLLSVCHWDGSLFVGGSQSRISKWSLKSSASEGEMTLERPNPKQHTLIWCLVALQDEMLASGDSIGLVHVWDTVAMVVLHRFAQHQADVLTLAASADGELLLSSGVDAKVAQYARQRGRQERWVYADTPSRHSHDVRAMVFDPSLERKDSHTYISGGVAGRLFVHEVTKKGRHGRPAECSPFNPFMQKAVVMEKSRLVLCQLGGQLQLWYMKEPGVQGVDEDDPRLPQLQLLANVHLAGKAVGPDGTRRALHYIAACALSEDGKRLAASDMTGTRLFEVSIEQLQVRRAELPEEMTSVPMRCLHFCGSLLAAATWHDHRILLLDCEKRQIVATFEHQRPVTQLAWRQPYLVANGVVYNVEQQEEHHAVPIGQRMATAVGFSADGHVVVVTSSHELMVFDIEKQKLVRQLDIPASQLMPHARVCGVAAFEEVPEKLLLWGHSFLLSVKLGESIEWQLWPERHVLGLSAVAWGAHTTAKFRKDQGIDREKPLTVLAVEVTPEDVQQMLPVAFERKEYTSLKGSKRKAPSET